MSGAATLPSILTIPCHINATTTLHQFDAGQSGSRCGVEGRATPAAEIDCQTKSLSSVDGMANHAQMTS